MDLRLFRRSHVTPDRTIDDGEAVLIAAAVVQRASSSIEIVWDFVRRIDRRPAEDEADRDVYLVGWRDDDSRYEVTVALNGRPGKLVRVSEPSAAAARLQGLDGDSGEPSR